MNSLKFHPMLEAMDERIVPDATQLAVDGPPAVTVAPAVASPAQPLTVSQGDLADDKKPLSPDEFTAKLNQLTRELVLLQGQEQLAEKLATDAQKDVDAARIARDAANVAYTAATNALATLSRDPNCDVNSPAYKAAQDALTVATINKAVADTRYDDAVNARDKAAQTLLDISAKVKAKTAEIAALRQSGGQPTAPKSGNSASDAVPA